MARVEVERLENNIPKTLDAIRELQGDGINAGVLSDAEGDLQMIANVHEFGARIDVTEDMRSFFWAMHYETEADVWKHMALMKKETIVIPERPFLRPTLENHADEIQQVFKAELLQIVEGSNTVENLINEIGETVVSFIRREMGANGPDLSDATLLMRRGGGAATPLKDDGRLQDSIAWERIA